MLWNRNFSLLVAATVLFHISIYMLFPSLHRWMIEEWGYTELQSAFTTVVLALSMFFLGAFNSYLMDTFSRKQVCVRSLLLVAVLTFLYPYVTAGWQVVLLRVVQGGLCGITLMATGSTLAIDVTSSNKRDAANRVYAWAHIVALFIGIVCGWQGRYMYEPMQLFHLSACLCIVSALLVWLVRVCFRAPLDLPLCSLDRFILPRALPPGINQMMIPIVLGMLFVSFPAVPVYVGLSVGFFVGLFANYLLRQLKKDFVRILVGQLLMMGGLYLLNGSTQTYAEYLVGGALVGVGTCLSVCVFLQMFILLPRHCERGTGFHTYRLSWETGLVLGILVGKCMQVWGYNPFPLELAICVAGTSAYASYVQPYFKNHYQQH